jgi:hypothetical protein
MAKAKTKHEHETTPTAIAFKALLTAESGF